MTNEPKTSEAARGATESMREHAVRLTTTLNRLQETGACRGRRFASLVLALGGAAVDYDAPINLLTILDHSGVEPCLSALSATVENCNQVARLIAADLAESVLHLFESEQPKDERPRLAIATARAYAFGEIEAAALDEAWAAAVAAARNAHGIWSPPEAAAWAAAWVASAAASLNVVVGAWSAGGAAAYTAGVLTEDRAAQAVIIRRYLLPSVIGDNA